MHRSVVAALAGWSVIWAQSARAAQFVPLGHLPGVGHASVATDVSADGSVVVGYSAHTEIYVFDGGAFRWTHEGGMVAWPGGPATSIVRVSADGEVIAGTPWIGGRAYRGTSSGERQLLGALTETSTSYAFGISADGSVIVGGSYATEFGQAFRWTTTNGMIGLGDLPGGSDLSTAWGVSGDGSVVVGWGNSGGQEAFRWTSDGGMIGLGDLTGHGFDSAATATSFDGSVVVGWSMTAPGRERPEAFRWTNDGGMVGLGDLPGGGHESYANDVSADGSVVVGWSHSESGTEAFIWDATHQMRRLSDVLTDAGVDLAGWTLREATALSADATTIVGHGVNPLGQTEAWLARISAVPEPSTASALLAGMLSLAGWRRATSFTVRRKRSML